MRGIRAATRGDGIRAALLLGIAVAIGACGAVGAPSSEPPSPPGSPGRSAPVATPPPSEALARPTDGLPTPLTQAVSGLFEPFDDVTFRPVDEATVDGFSTALGASLEGEGSLGDVRLAEAVRGDDPPVLTAAFTLVAADGGDDQELFALVTDDIAGSFGADWEDALDGQAIRLETPSQTVVVLPWRTLPDGGVVFLLVSGPEAAGVDRVAAGLAD